jgi:ornithine carbamoyltransferase
MYGPEKLLLCGFPAEAQSKFAGVLEMAGLAQTPVVWANQEHAGQTLSDLLQLPDGSGSGSGSTLSRAVIVSGITENQLHSLMTVCRKSGMKQALWAALTPTSETWPLDRLLEELNKERKALSKRKGK